MRRSFMELSNKKVHFIGVSGIGVSAVAYLSIMRGYKVSGSAIEKNKLVEGLEKMGMKFYLGHRAKNIDNADLVVRSAAVNNDNPEVKEAYKKGIDVIFYSKYLGMLMSEKKGIAIAGTHGKTTTTAMVATILKHSNLHPEVVCGGIMKEFHSNAIYGVGEYFVAEACEYNRSFLDLSKKYGVITNIEPDHLDYYGSFDMVLDSFREFIMKIDRPGFFIINGDDKAILEIVDNLDVKKVKVGFGEKNDVVIENVQQTGRNSKYNIRLKNKDIFNNHASDILPSKLSLKLSIPGGFNIMNSALASVLALKLGIESKYILEAVKNFKGTERRLDEIGTYLGNPVISDYAHHPTEISVTIKAIKNKFPDRKLLVVFQPHQYSRTALLFNKFVETLSLPDYLIITDIYKQRDSEEFLKMVQSKDLFNEIKKLKREGVFLIKNPENIWSFIKDFVNSNDFVLVFMGAGSIDKYARRMPYSV